MSESGDEKPHQGGGRRRRMVGGRSRDGAGRGGGGGGGGGSQGRGGNSDEKELASQLIQIQSKRFYIDVKENQRGRFIKLAEVGVGGRKSRILMTMNAASEFKQRLIEFSELHSSLGPSHGIPSETANVNVNEGAVKRGGDSSGNDGLIKSETIVKDRKRYYLDLKENQRGRFLRVSMVVSRGPRAYLAIPAQGLIEFKDHLSELLDKYGLDLEGESGAEPGAQSAAPRDTSAGSTGRAAAQASNNDNLPESKSLRADNKTFYFDCGSNQRGVFLKISEVRQNRYRTSITVPEKFLKEFQEQINEFAQMNLSSSQENKAAAAAVDPAAAAAKSTDEKASDNGKDTAVVGVKVEASTK